MTRGQNPDEIHSQQYRYSIFTVPLLNGKVYVVSSPATVAQVQRHQKTIVFDLLSTDIAVRISGHGPDIKEILDFGVHSEDKNEREDCIINIMHDYEHTSLGPGEILDEISIVQLNAMAETVGQVSGDRQVDLFIWVRQMITMTNMLAFYGPKHIFTTEPELVESFWKFESNLTIFMASFLPYLFAPRAYAAREKVKKAMVRYAEKGYVKGASKFVQVFSSLPGLALS